MRFTRAELSDELVFNGPSTIRAGRCLGRCHAVLGQPELSAAALGSAGGGAAALGAGGAGAGAGIGRQASPTSRLRWKDGGDPVAQARLAELVNAFLEHAAEQCESEMPGMPWPNMHEVPRGQGYRGAEYTPERDPSYYRGGEEQVQEVGLQTPVQVREIIATLPFGS